MSGYQLAQSVTSMSVFDLESLYEAARTLYECKVELDEFEDFIEDQGWVFEAIKEEFGDIRSSYMSHRNQASSAADVLDVVHRIVFGPKQDTAPPLTVRKLSNKYQRFTS